MTSHKLDCLCSSQSHSSAPKLFLLSDQWGLLLVYLLNSQPPLWLTPNIARWVPPMNCLTRASDSLALAPSSCPEPSNQHIQAQRNILFVSILFSNYAPKQTVKNNSPISNRLANFITDKLYHFATGGRQVKN